MLRIRIASLVFSLAAIFAGVVPAAMAAKEPVAEVAVATTAESARINLNSADVAALQAGLIGIGETKAKAIVQYRDENGPFASVDDLLEVKGIGAKTLEKNRDRLRID
ncbi:ComEA family DNA-binding protein [Pseudomonas boanensis]|uniref:ComEA family DNA-binding protein n=1 Tax=Metapseudomonas boanensis TaxID=2822138 RepID=UPI0035D465A6